MSSTVTNVTEHTAGSELATAASATDTTLSVINVNEFDQDGGYLNIGGTLSAGVLTGGEQFAYTYTLPVDGDGVDIAPEDGSGDLDLVGSLANPYDAGEPVHQVNSDGTLFVERFAYALEPDGEEELKLRVPHTLFALLPLGSRDEETAEQVTFAQDGTDEVVTDVLGRAPNYRAHLTATGLDLAAGTSSSPPDDNQVRWLRTSDGTAVVALYSYTSTGTGPTFKALTTKDTANPTQSTISLVADGDSSASLSLRGHDTGQSVAQLVGNYVQTSSFTIEGPGGVSDFLFDNAWADWTPTLTGWSANPTNSVYRYKQEGKKVTVTIRQATSGTSNSVNKSISLPVSAPAATITNMAWSAPCRATDNGTDLVAPSNAQITSGGTVIDLAKTYDATSGGWTNSGGHRIRTLQIIYEAA